jgi:hypothetical protein
MTMTATYTPLRAPAEHGQAFIDPPLGDALSLIDSNRLQAANNDCDLQGISLARLAAAARADLLSQARRYTSAYRDVDPLPGDEVPILLTGHQPHLFHAGVWFKNFCLASLARRTGGLGINLLIDNDILHNPAIRVPLDGAQPRVTTLAFDRVGRSIPYEERRIVDPDLFRNFGQRVLNAVRPVIPSPLIADYWPLVTRAAERSSNLGRNLAEARHCLEGVWGLNTWEVPLSAVCDAQPFAWFTAHLLANLPRLHEVYNASLAEYRRANRIRSRSHPVPDLAVDGPWLEAPFWLWRTDAPHRGRMFVRSCGEQLELSDRRDIHLRLPLSPDQDAARAVARLSELVDERIKLRPRALTTTLYARLLLSDLFLHGIGGAKYDQLTDLILYRFFGVQPPAFMTLTATVLLFEDRTRRLAQQVRETRQQLREFRYHPERHVARSPDTDRLSEEKRGWIQRQLPRGQRGQRHGEIERINQRLSERLVERHGQLVRELAATRDQLRQQQALASREFAFCLFPEATLRPLLLELSSCEV